MQPIVRVAIGCVAGILGILWVCHALCMRLERPMAMLTVSAQIMQAPDEPETVSMYEVGESTDPEEYVGSAPNPECPTDDERVTLSVWVRAIPTRFMWRIQDPDPSFWLGQAANAVLFSLIGFRSFHRRNLSRGPTYTTCSLMPSVPPVAPHQHPAPFRARGAGRPAAAGIRPRSGGACRNDGGRRVHATAWG